MRAHNTLCQRTLPIPKCAERELQEHVVNRLIVDGSLKAIRILERSKLPRNSVLLKMCQPAKRKINIRCATTGDRILFRIIAASANVGEQRLSLFVIAKPHAAAFSHA